MCLCPPSTRAEKSIAIRAGQFYVFFLAVTIVAIYLIVAVVSPKHPEILPYPEWTLDYVFWQLARIPTFTWASPYVPAICTPSA